MISGRLNKRVTIEHLARTRDGRLGEELVQKQLFSARADVQFGSMKRVDENGNLYLSSDITFIFWIHYRRLIGEYDHIIYNGTRYRIDSIEPAESSMMLYVRGIRDDGESM